jgi:hypothetical protein
MEAKEMGVSYGRCVIKYKAGPFGNMKHKHSFTLSESLRYIVLLLSLFRINFLLMRLLSAIILGAAFGTALAASVST